MLNTTIFKSNRRDSKQKCLQELVSYFNNYYPTNRIVDIEKDWDSSSGGVQLEAVIIYA